jgi:hypothetical protein
MPPKRQEKVTTRDRNIKRGENPCVQMSEVEAKRWLTENDRWIITRNDKTWDGKKIKPGDHFRFKNGVREEKDVTCLNGDGTEKRSTVCPPA